LEVPILIDGDSTLFGPIDTKEALVLPRTNIQALSDAAKASILEHWVDIPNESVRTEGTALLDNLEKVFPSVG